jgi:SAM-dependent methyltransferase
MAVSELDWISIMTDAWNARARSFDTRSAQYDEVRPSYPIAAIDEILRFGQFGAAACALEVGPGTGKATRLFLARGIAVTGLEPGPRLIETAREVCNGPVTFLNTSFEDWPLERGAYDLVFAAQSFHWVDQHRGYAKAGEALRGGGTLALFWNRTKVVPSPVQAQLAALYLQRAPELDGLTPTLLAAIEESIVNSIAATKLFDVQARPGFAWSDRMVAARYVRLLETQSDHAALPESHREDLLDGVAKLIEASGGEIDVHYETVVHLARRRVQTL